MPRREYQDPLDRLRSDVPEVGVLVLDCLERVADNGVNIVAEPLSTVETDPELVY